MTSTPSLAFEVRRDDLRTTRVEAGALDPAALAAAGKVVLAIDRFALTANNITYAAFGDSMSYWAFFPAGDGFGRIPVWGFADVVASGHADIAVGERIFGYFPMATHLVVDPDRVTARSFADASAHRSALPPVYNVYERTAADPAYAPAREPAQMILRPLVITSFLIADFLADNSLFGARQVIVSSASSKTALGLGFSLKALGLPGLTTLGLTSAGNRAFVEAAGYFDRAVPYDDLAGLDPLVPTVFVDMAGNAALAERIHRHFADCLVYSCRVGATHWEARGDDTPTALPGAKPKFFFAPAQIRKRAADWGPGGVERNFAKVWTAIVADAPRWLTIREARGADAVERAFHETLEARVPPSEGLVLSLTT